MTKQQLEKLYSEGRAPTPAQILGPGMPTTEWRVNMLTGPIPDMGGWPLRHRKRFHRGYGRNVLLRDTEWGRFDCFYGFHSSTDCLMLDYGGSGGNGRLTSRIRDFVRTTPDPDVLLGKFFFLWRGKLRGGWFFKLTRAK